MAGDILGVFDYADLDGEAALLRGQPSTGENLAAQPGSRFTERLGKAIDHVRVWETPDHQFEVEM